jgi:hypothetical protein
MLGPAAVLAATWTLFQIAIDLRNGKQGWGLVAWNAIGTLFMISILVALAAVVEVSALGARVRTFAMVGAGIVAAAVGLAIFIPIALAVGYVVSSRSMPVMWWNDFGVVALLVHRAALAYDYRVRSERRAAALREARLQAAGVLRRTAEVRLQAMQARIDPRFLFDTLAAVERIHDVDACRGRSPARQLIKYLRAVMPTSSRLDRRSARSSSSPRMARHSRHDRRRDGRPCDRGDRRRRQPALSRDDDDSAGGGRAVGRAGVRHALDSRAMRGCADDGPYRLPLAVRRGAASCRRCTRGLRNCTAKRSG